MSDVDVRLSRLEAYRDSMKRHMRTVAEDFQNLQLYWRVFEENYAGQAAEQFKTAWMSVTKLFDSYVERGEKIDLFLTRSVDDLRELARPRDL